MCYYTILNLTPSATQAEIKSAYRKLALIYHPDKQGDPIKFKELNNAYMTLSDPEKRAKYDCFGDDNKIEFDEQNNTYVIPIPLTLMQIYTGYIHKQKVITKKTCGDCILKMDTCPDCSGSGKIMQLVQHGPFMQQMQAKCPSCISGQKKREGVKYECLLCGGNGHCTGSKDIEIKFQPGNLDITKNIQVGELRYIFNGSITPHDIYTIKNQDLHCDIDVPLFNSLTETFSITLPFLDGTDLCISPDFMILPGDKYVIPGKGITKTSNLFVNFNVVFPEKITEKRKEYLKKMYNIEDKVINPLNKIKLVKYNPDMMRQEENMFGDRGGPFGMPFGVPGNVKVQNCSQQ